jgi:hypothetical protein
MTNAVAVPLLILLLVAVIVALAGPAVRGRAGAIGAKLRALRPEPAGDSRLRQLSRLIRDGVVRGAARTLYTTLLPPTVRVEVGPEDAALLQRHLGVVEVELNHQWAAMAEREGWQIPGHIFIEVAAADRDLPRPHLHLLYEDTAPTGADATWVDPDDRTPLAEGWAVVVAGNRIPVAGQKVVGRRAPQSDIVVNEVAASRRHVRLVERPDGRLEVTDINSTNGTWIGGVRLTAPRILDDDTEIGLGKDFFISVERR